MVPDRRQRRYDSAVLHLFGYECAVAGGFDRLHDSAQEAGRRLRHHPLDRRPQLVDALQQGAL